MVTFMDNRVRSHYSQRLMSFDVFAVYYSPSVYIKKQNKVTMTTMLLVCLQNLFHVLKTRN